MDLDAYQQAALKTAIYPNVGNNLLYVSLGLAGETGEVPNKVKKILRDSAGVLTDEMKEAIKSELGDVAWYIALTAQELHIAMSELSTHESMVYGAPVYGPCLDMCKETGRVAEIVSELLLHCDAEHLNTSAIRMCAITPGLLADPLRRCLAHLHAMAEAIGSSFDEVLEANIQKLSSRNERGALQGSGDNR